MQAYELELALPIWEPGKTDVPPRHVRVVCRLAPSVEIQHLRGDRGRGRRGRDPEAHQRRRGGQGGVGGREGEAARGVRAALDRRPEAAQVPQARHDLCVRLHPPLRARGRQDVGERARRVRRAPEREGWRRSSSCSPRIRAASSRSRRRAPPAPTRSGMVAWLVTLYTPEYPTGREMVVIANDITFANGTFGPLEDIVFERASQFARASGIPRIYVGANSGARFGLSEAVRKCFRVQWNDPYDFTRGITYLWLTDKDIEALGPAVVTERVPVPPTGAAVEDEDEDERDDEEKRAVPQQDRLDHRHRGGPRRRVAAGRGQDRRRDFHRQPRDLHPRLLDRAQHRHRLVRAAPRPARRSSTTTRRSS